MSLQWRGGEGRSVDWPITVAAAALVMSPLVGTGGGLHSANTSQYYTILNLNTRMIFTLLTGSMALHFTATGAPLAMRCI
jgi:hypothetical protein